MQPVVPSNPRCSFQNRRPICETDVFRPAIRFAAESGALFWAISMFGFNLKTAFRSGTEHEGGYIEAISKDYFEMASNIPYNETVRFRKVPGGRVS